jgi:autotransporter-associated beta strand protein
VVIIGPEGALQIGTGGLAGTLNAPSIVNNDFITFNFTDSTTLSAPVSGTGSLEKFGAGTLTLLGANSYSGETFIENGTVVAAATSALGTGFVEVSGASTTLRISPGSSETNSVTMFGGATLDNFGTLSAPTGSSPTVFVNSGGTVIDEAGATITNTNPGGIAIVGSISDPTLTVTNAGTISSKIGIQLQFGIDGNITNSSTGVITGTGGTAIDGFTFGSGIVTFSNAGRVNGSVTLNSIDPNTDFPLVNAVTLFTGSSITGNLNLNSPSAATLTLDGTGAWSLNQAVAGGVTNFFSLTKQGAGTWTINQALTYSGGTNINGGTLIAATTGALGSGLVTVNDPSLLRIDPGVTVTNFIELTNAGAWTTPELYR